MKGIRCLWELTLVIYTYKRLFHTGCYYIVTSQQPSLETSISVLFSELQGNNVPLCSVTARMDNVPTIVPSSTAPFDNKIYTTLDLFSKAKDCSSVSHSKLAKI